MSVFFAKKSNMVEKEGILSILRGVRYFIHSSCTFMTKSTKSLGFRASLLYVFTVWFPKIQKLLPLVVKQFVFFTEIRTDTY
jgi:hypothetical protein